MRATYKGYLLAESDDTVVVEGNHYFPADSLAREHFTDSAHTSGCPWKGTASYYHVAVPGEPVNENAAWYYPEPKAAAEEIGGRVAFWRGVEVRN